MPLFRKKPVVIEAIHVASAIEDIRKNWGALPRWFHEAYEKGTIISEGSKLKVKTLEGEMTAEFEDWIVRGVKGELYPIKSDILAATYEKVMT